MRPWVSVRRQLTEVFGFSADTARAVTKKVKPRYREITDRLPEFEKADRFKMNIVNCALLGALVLSMPERPDVERLTDFYEYPCGSGYEGRFTRYGICTLMQELGSYDLTLALCHPDYTMSETGGATSFVRTYTLASGGPYCDCGYKKYVKKVPLGFLGVLAAQDLNAGGAEQHTGGKHGKSLHGRSLLCILQQLDVANRHL